MQALLFVTGSKTHPARSFRKYARFSLAPTTIAFPVSARHELAAFPKNHAWLLESSIPEDAAEEANSSWISAKKIPVELSGECFYSPPLLELECLEKWKCIGVRAQDMHEYEVRRKNLDARLKELCSLLFQTPKAQEFSKRADALKNPRVTETDFVHKRDFLSKTVSDRFVSFKNEALEFLRRPRELKEICLKTNAGSSHARCWLNKLIKMGLVSRTRERKGIGRPKYVYYLSRRLV